MVSKNKLTKEELKREPLLNIWLRKLQSQVTGVSGSLIQYGIGLATILVVIGGIYAFYNNNHKKAEAAFSKAFEIYNTEVKDPKSTETSPPSAAPSNKKIYNDEKQKYTEAVAAFDAASKYSSKSDISHYYAGLCRLKLDPVQGQKDLKPLAEMGNGQISLLARQALADSYLATGQIDSALDLYRKLDEIAEKETGTVSVISKVSTKMALARIQELKGDDPKAIQIYVKIIESYKGSHAAIEAFDRLKVLDSEAAQRITPPKLDESLM